MAEDSDDVGGLACRREFTSHQRDGAFTHALKVLIAEAMEDGFHLPREGDDLPVVDRYSYVGSHVDASTSSVKSHDDATGRHRFQGRQAEAFALVEREKHG